MLRPPLDVVGEHVAAGDLVLLAPSIGWPGFVRRLASVLLRTATWSASGMPSSMPMTRIGITDAELGDDVEAARADERVEDADAELAHLVLERGHRAAA